MSIDDVMLEDLKVNTASQLLGFLMVGTTFTSAEEQSLCVSCLSYLNRKMRGKVVLLTDPLLDAPMGRA